MVTKINFDVAYCQKEAKSGSGVVAQNHHGEILASGQYLHSNVDSPFVAEGFTCLQAIQMGAQLKLSSIIIEGDAKTIIKNVSLAKKIDRSYGLSFKISRT